MKDNRVQVVIVNLYHCLEFLKDKKISLKKLTDIGFTKEVLQTWKRLSAIPEEDFKCLTRELCIRRWLVLRLNMLREGCLSAWIEDGKLEIECRYQKYAVVMRTPPATRRELYYFIHLLNISHIICNLPFEKGQVCLDL